MVKPFSRSKRVPVRLRHKIEKASASKKRKDRKEAKTNPQWRSRLKKDPGIPNLFPFKDKILEEIEEKKRKKAEEAQQLRNLNKKQQRKAADSDDDEADKDEDMDEGGVSVDEEMEEGDDPTYTANPMAALLSSAQARAAAYDTHNTDANDQNTTNIVGNDLKGSSTLGTDYRNPDSSRKTFDKVFKQVLEAADVILYVLDARDPEGTRSREVERQVMAADSGSKRLMLVLNKVDLVPSDVLNGWLKHLRRSFPTLPLSASTPASNAQTFEHKQHTIRNTSEALLRSLKSFAASKGLKRSISVGVIGYPNVGKSSVINALTSRMSKGPHSAVCPVGSEAGITTALREVKVDGNLKILDSPGIVFPSDVNAESKDSGSSKRDRKIEHEARLILLNALPPAQMSDPQPAVTMLLERMSRSQALHEKLLQHYGVAALGPFNQGDTTTDFLVQVARKRGRLGKGGVPNLHAAAQIVITDWRDGRIQGWVEPPVLKISNDAEMAGSDIKDSLRSADHKIIVKEWAEEFKLEGLWNDTG